MTYLRTYLLVLCFLILAAHPAPLRAAYPTAADVAWTQRVSVATGGTEANGKSQALDISADGRFVDDLSLGEHTLTLTVRDSTGQSSQAQITVTVTETVIFLPQLQR